MKVRPALVILGVAAILCLGSPRIQPAYQQSVTTSTSYSTQVLTVLTTQTLTRTWTSVFTVTSPQPPRLDIKSSFQLWYWVAPPGSTYNRVVSRVRTSGNITNLSEQVLWEVRLKYELGDDKNSEFFYHTVDNLNPGEKKDFQFEYNVEGRLYNVDKAWVRYGGVDQYKTPVKTTTFLQTNTIAEPSISTGAVALTTVRKIEYTYTTTAEAPQVPFWQNTALVGGIIALVAVAVGVGFFFMRRQRVSPPKVAVPPAYAPPPSAVATKYCISCGQSIPAQARHCPKCGAAQQ